MKIMREGHAGGFLMLRISHSPNMWWTEIVVSIGWGYMRVMIWGSILSLVWGAIVWRPNMFRKRIDQIHQDKWVEQLAARAQRPTAASDEQYFYEVYHLEESLVLANEGALQGLAGKVPGDSSLAFGPWL
ncbi:hypothetical protein BY996DRAFT_6530899 [Phakopsora pachyrhizi]|nr:hypothetical protein BY996DRAFT_6530899 [Phakopsora pachyrhizi]